MTQGWISQLENGPPINQLDRLTSWAQLLRIPQEHLWFDLPGGPSRVGDDGRGAPEASVTTVVPDQGTSLDLVPARPSPDLSYYEGLSCLLVQEPDAAGTAFQAALDNLPPTRVKARSILMLSVALAAARAHRHDEAATLVGDALALAGDQPIRRTWQRATEVRTALEPARSLPAMRDLDEQLVVFAGSLEPIGSS